MGGSNQQAAAGAGAMPEVRKATLPTAADYRYENMMAQKDVIKKENQEQLANYIMGAGQSIAQNMGAFKQPQSNASQWRNVQNYSQTPGSNSLQFTPLSPQQIFDDNRNAPMSALIGGIGSFAGGALSGLTMGSGAGLGAATRARM
jgi:hypothetical protein